MHPIRRADFKVLELELEAWRLQETARIKAAGLDAEKEQVRGVQRFGFRALVAGRGCFQDYVGGGHSPVLGFLLINLSADLDVEKEQVRVALGYGVHGLGLGVLDSKLEARRLQEAARIKAAGLDAEREQVRVLLGTFALWRPITVTASGTVCVRGPRCSACVG